MKRTTQSRMAINTQVISEVIARNNLAKRLGWGYKGKRKLYEALGYPENDNELTFEYYFNKYDRGDFAAAIIDRPVDGTWRGDIAIVEPGAEATESPLNKIWQTLNETLSIKSRLNKVDKLCDLGRYSVLLLGLDDVKKDVDFKRPVSGKRKLLYLKQFSESSALVNTWETDTNNPRYGLPLTYKIQSGTVQATGTLSTTTVDSKELIVHFSRVLHFVSGNLTSEVYGVSKLKKPLNRLIDLEKILGGDAEMFWRGARPGYTASAKEDYELGAEEEADLMVELDKYEHDLRRFIVTKGIDIEALQVQISDPLHHIDAQLQAISALTGIPKRILIGSERGELASSQDKDQFKELVQTRQEEHAEPMILRPLIKKLMEYGVLPKVESFNIMWADIFAPSESQKVAVGMSRATALKTYADSPLASAILAPGIAMKVLLGLNEEQVQEAIQAMDDQALEERKLAAEAGDNTNDPNADPNQEDPTATDKNTPPQKPTRTK